MEKPAKPLQVDAVIIGAGITGLVTAYQLLEKGKKVVLLEKNHRTGGQLRTILKNGFTLEAGPNTGVLNNVETAQLFEQLQPQIHTETARKEANIRLVWKGKRFHPLPNGPWSGLTTPLFSFGDKLGLCLEPWRQKGKNPMESVGALARRRLGISFFQYAVDPFVSGIYAGDPDRLITRFALPKLYNLEQNYGSFIRGAIQLRKKQKTEEEKKVTKEVFSVPGGFEQLAQVLTQAVGMENIRLNVAQTTLSASSEFHRWKTVINNGEEEIRSRFVITTVPAHTIPELLSFAKTNDVECISNMPYAPVVQIGVGIKGEAHRIPTAFGGLIPSCEQKNVLGILFPSRFFNQRAPKNAATLSFFLGGIQHPDIIHWDDNRICETVQKALTGLLGFPDKYTPDTVCIFRHKHAIPQYEADSGTRLSAIKRLQNQHPGLILAGGIRDGIGLSDRIKQGFKIAEGIV